MSGVFRKRVNQESAQLLTYVRESLHRESPEVGRRIDSRQQRGHIRAAGLGRGVRQKLSVATESGFLYFLHRLARIGCRYLFHNGTNMMIPENAAVRMLRKSKPPREKSIYTSQTHMRANKIRPANFPVSLPEGELLCFIDAKLAKNTESLAINCQILTIFAFRSGSPWCGRGSCVGCRLASVPAYTCRF